MANVWAQEHIDMYTVHVSTRECGRGGGAPVISVNHLYQLSSLGAWCSTHVQYLQTKHMYMYINTNCNIVYTCT